MPAGGSEPDGLEERARVNRSLLLLGALSVTAFPEPVRAQSSAPYFYMQIGDYPADALAAHQEGDVPIVLHIRRDGTIQDCSVESGPRLLRRASCAVVAQRGLFRPEAKEGGPAVRAVRAVATWKIPTAPQVSDFGGATPISAPQWITDGDYPLEALRRGQQGAVDIAFDIGENGRATACTILKSSGSVPLDRTTCGLIEQRAAFLPAVDSSGTVRATKGRTRFTWRLP
jgi:TonB family protein